ncbi:MAG: DNA-3-methyladenine glycosylase 2 family protein [Sneathiella sp.]|nr:DNA-3-methyladenine glycosylase 2 family protein [Sneathiella sp.]
MEEPGLKTGLEYLSKRDADFARALTLITPIPSRTQPPGFEYLTKIIIEQQVSLASAAAIWKRMKAAINPFTPERVLTFSEEMLRELGLSRQKAVYCRALADDIIADRISLSALPVMNDFDVHKTLTSVKGIGRWTAEIYMIACLNRQDIWPAGDVALKVSLQHLKGLESRPSIEDMDAHSELWRPYRTIAARILWRYYADVVQAPSDKKK